MSTSVRLSAPADPGPNENPRKAIHWSRGKKATFFYGGVEGWRRLPFPFRILLNQGLMFISSFIKEKQGQERMEHPDHLYLGVCEVGGFRSRQDVCRLRQGRKPEELEKTLFNKGLL